MIKSVLRRLQERVGLPFRDPMFRQIRAVLDMIPIDFGGGCSLRKAYAMAQCIRAEQIKVSVDIGVYRGRSLFPQVIAHAMNAGGVAYGVDPFEKGAARESDNPAMRAEIDRWVDETDYEALYRTNLRRLRERGLDAHGKLVRKRSADAARDFRRIGTRIGLVHIDGNHDIEPVLDDLRLYSPLLDERAFVVMDDISWDSVRPAYKQAASQFSLLGERVEAGRDDFAIFWKGPEQDLQRMRQQIVFCSAVAGGSKCVG